jgi:hypothetical protein
LLSIFFCSGGKTLTPSCSSSTPIVRCHTSPRLDQSMRFAAPTSTSWRQRQPPCPRGNCITSCGVNQLRIVRCLCHVPPRPRAPPPPGRGPPTLPTPLSVSLFPVPFLFSFQPWLPLLSLRPGATTINLTLRVPTAFSLSGVPPSPAGVQHVT